MVKTYLLGEIDPALFSACLIAGLVGIVFILLLGTKLRDPSSAESPIAWSWSYLWNDNLKRILLSVLTVIISLRFMTELFGWELTVWKGFVVGVGWDSIALLIKQKTNLLDTKTKPEDGN